MRLTPTHRRSGLFAALVLTAALCALLPATALCQGARGGRGAGAAAAGLRFRPIGPGIVSGRIVALAVVPGHASTYYVAAASGGVWKTTNDGATFTPIFDREGSYSIGTITLDPSNPSTVWVGTGENNSQRTVSYGDGVYRSDDGGASWRNVGLKDSQHIGKIIVAPDDSNTVYVASEGPLWNSGGDRGVFKTTDGGKTWTNTLSISEHTGASDLVMDPRHPQVLYAATYQRERHVYTLIDGGPESAIYKTTDGGKNWTRLRGGLPAGDLGRIGLSISPADPNIIYATVEAANRGGGVFRSTDGGATWEKRNPIQPGAMYYSQITADPKLPGRVYELDTTISVSNDGGATFAALGEPNKHVDNHVIWVDPADNDHYLVGCDGGLYESWDRAASWEWKTNLPLGQFVDVATDNALPFYNIYGGTQDNNDEGGPSRTYSSNGIGSADWRITHGGDGFHNAVDPTDPNIVYSESQGGGISRVNLKTHEDVGIQPQPGANEAGFRWGWDAPFFVSHFDHNRLYMGANKLFRTDDRGNTWKEISPDLTRALDRDSLPVMGRIWGPSAVAKNASTDPYGKIDAIAESPKQDGLLYVGTDDGLVQITTDGGAHWTRVDKFPGVPNESPNLPFVSRIIASQTDPATVYVALENHKNGDYKPYLVKSTDRGATWTSISSNLPENGSVLALAQDDVDGNLLFAGTEYGLFYTTDGGGHWTQMRGGLPTIAVRDLAIQRREHDLVVGTFGRGIYILDDYTPLRKLDSLQASTAPGAVLPARPALEYLQDAHYGAGGKADNGAAFFTADNLGPDALLTYYIKTVPTTLREDMTRREQQAERAATNFAPYPTAADLKAQAKQAPPAYSLVISDSSGKAIRVLGVPARAGLGRVNWDLRNFGGAQAGRGRGGAATPPAGGGGGRGAPAAPVAPPEGGGAPGALVLPGKYQVSLVEHFGGKWTTLGGPEPIEVVADPASTPALAEMQAHVAFEQKVAKLQADVAAAQAYATELGTRLTALRATAAAYPVNHQALEDRTEAAQVQFAAIEDALRGGGFGGEGPAPPSLQSRLSAAGGNERASLSRPTTTDTDAYNYAATALAAVLPKLRAFGATTLPALEQEFVAAGAPVAGRLPGGS
ncbi:MAG TPA: hypothetical protein VN709_09495 [Terriglobales bacterium]|nr:hypothetical protein [Terriglobales bacterium]